ncbi:MAG: hypothetical protein CVT79_02770 [Alphaproteobacteria bacterium HGW-Alphaproteobacteria-18]|nr:MAG: hypothetical protein CVT79_02770 [Alphaproteobacteria bacterium HGW-Alphaproteobacteria-18]
MAGWALFAGGFVITNLAARQFRLARTNINTFGDPGTLVTTGLFAVSALHYIPYEERAASAIFGETYAAYRARVRRWI